MTRFRRAVLLHGAKNLHIICAFVIMLASAAPTRAQVATGLPPYGSLSGGPDVVDNANLNVHLSFPVLQKAGVGIPFSYILSYDTSVWSPDNPYGGYMWSSVGGWATQATVGWATFNAIQALCPGVRSTCYTYGNCTFVNEYKGWKYFDRMNTEHDLQSSVTVYDYSACSQQGSGPYTATATTTDQLYSVTVNASPEATTAVDVHGYTFNMATGTVTDSNGNSVTDYSDTLGMTVLTETSSGSLSNPPITWTYTYTNAQGQQESVKVISEPQTVRTNFGCSGVYESGPTTVALVSEIDLPDGTKYTFSYEQTPGYSGDVTGRLSQLTLPTGGYITYSYSGGSNGINCSDGSTPKLTRTLYDNNGHSSGWTYTHSESGSAWTTDITAPADPQGNQAYTAIQFQNLFETERDIYTKQGGTLLETIYTCYNGASFPCNSTAVSLPIARRTVTTSMGGLESQVNTYYNTYNMPTEVDEYDWGSGTVGSLLRKTTTAYDTSLGSIEDRPLTVTTYSGSLTQVAQTTYTWDSKGNMQSASSGGLSKSFTHNGNGTVNVATDTNSAQTTYYYNGTGGCNNAFPTSIVGPTGLTTTMTWNCNAGIVATSKDANGQTTSYSYNDPFSRLTSTSYPDGGSVSIAYPNATEVQATTKITSGVSRTDTAYVDGLGRTISKTVAGVTTGTTYDLLGRVATSNVANSGAQDTYQYDALSRVTQVTHADSTYAQTSYSANCETDTDETSKQRKSCTDGLGRVTSVVEDPSGLDYQTTYGYDALNDLTGVTQGSETRSYQFDSLGRMTQATTPESGTAYFTYDSDSTCGTSAGDLVKRVDARGTRTCYAYDSIHRLTQTSYSDGTATANYYFDQTSYNGLTIQNGKGERTGMSDGSGQTAWSYDPMGRALAEEKTIAGVTKTIGYAYNYDGSLASLTYPSGRTISYGVDSLGRPQSAVDSANGINYALSATYAPQGALASVLNGQTSSFTGITYSMGYNNRLWPSSISASSSNGTALSLSYSYFANGNVDVITNNRDNGRTVTYGYDSLNRINSASTQASSGADCWGQAVPSSGYDRYANLLTINVTKCSAPSLSISVTGNNQVSGYSYNAAGDLTSDGSYSYTWDAENRLSSAGGVTYTYDGDGQRVKKSSGTLYWRGAGGSVLAETDTSGNTLNEYIFFGARMARRDSSGNVYYYFGSALGSATVTNATGSLCYDADFYPFGGEVGFTNTCSQNYKFAGMEQDSETGGYHTWFRQYATMGRWLSPDPLGGDITNPQSLNRYAYVLDNPTTLIDPLGLDNCIQGKGAGRSVSCQNGGNDGQDDGSGLFLGFGSGGGGCELDGVAAPCNMVSAAVSSGGASQCPNNICSGLNSKGQYVQYVCTTEGCNYVPQGPSLPSLYRVVTISVTGPLPPNMDVQDAPLQTVLVQDYTAYPDLINGGYDYVNNIPMDMYLTDGPIWVISDQITNDFNNMLSVCDEMQIMSTEAAFFGLGPFGDAASKAMGYVGLAGATASLGCQ